MTDADNKTIEYLRCDFSDPEITEFAKALGRETQELQRIEETKKRVAADLKAQIEEKNGEISRLSRLVTNGHEYRNVDCQWTFDDPRDGMKTLYRLDTNREVNTVPMTPADKQAVLEFAS